MKNLYVIGGDGFARECYQQIKLLENIDNKIRFTGFVGHNGYKVDFKELNKYFICDLSEFKFTDNDYAIIGAAMPTLRRKIYLDIKAKTNAKFYTLAPHMYTLIDLLDLGEGNIFMPPCGPSPHVKIGNANVFNGDVIIGHDVEIGEFNFFGPKSQILGNVKIGDNNTIGAGSILLPKAKIGNNNKIAPLSAVYKGCRNDCCMLGNPALKVGELKDEI